jgi:hypothetical protein
VAVEKLIYGKLAENSSRQDGLQTIFFELGRHFPSPGLRPFAQKDEFFNSHAC